MRRSILLVSLLSKVLLYGLELMWMRREEESISWKEKGKNIIWCYGLVGLHARQNLLMVLVSDFTPVPAMCYLHQLCGSGYAETSLQEEMKLCLG